MDKTSYEWLFFKRHSSSLRQGPFLMKLDRDLIRTEDKAHADFSGKLRMLALEVLSGQDDVGELQKALCILSVVGNEEDIAAVEALHRLDNTDLSIDIKTCVYEIRQGRNA